MAKTSERELKRGTLEMIILKLLEERQMYGYELITTLEQRGGPQFQLKEGTLYPVLYRQEDAGYIEARWETAERGVPRKYYRLTESGANQLTMLISEWEEFSGAINRLLGKEKGKHE
jgi:PadR family transcriptional regulator, regulatory protein PadR